MSRFFDVDVGEYIDIAHGSVIITLEHKSGRRARLRIDTAATTPVVARSVERIGACLQEPALVSIERVSTDGTYHHRRR